MNNLQSKIEHIAALAEREITPTIVDDLTAYANLLLEWNTKINVISRKDTDQIFEQHLAPSLAYFLLDMFTEEDERIVDIGSGGGLPALVNAICYRDRKFTLVDSTKKKVNVLIDVVKALNLKNCTCLWGRAEEIAFTSGHKAAYDMATSRGVSTLGNLMPLKLPFLKPDGIVLALKGGDMAEEIAGIKKRARFDITEYEMDERFHYIERFKTLKLVEIARGKKG